MIKPPLDSEALRQLFTKPYGEAGPTSEQWRAVYAEDVHFIDPTQEKSVDAYIKAQDGLIDAATMCSSKQSCLCIGEPGLRGMADGSQDQRR